MTPPPAISRKRACRRHSDRDNIPRDAPSTPPRKDWVDAIHDFINIIPTLWHEMDHPPLNNPRIRLRTPGIVFEGYSNLAYALSSALTAANNTCRIIAEQYNIPHQPTSPQTPPSPTSAPLASHAEQPEPEPAPKPAPEPKNKPKHKPEPEPTRPPQTYASILASRTPRQPRQAIPRAKPATFKLLNPVRLVVQPKGSGPLPIQSIPAPEFFRRLIDTCAKVPGSPTPLGAQWNRKDNLVLSFAAGTTRTAIKLLYPCIRLLLGSDEQPTFRFDVPWSKIHLAGIRARDCVNLPAASEEELRHTLLLNPAIQALKITVQPTWLKKPDEIAGTHTSAVIAFEDPDGSVARALLRSKIFAFGEMVSIKKWHDQPTTRK